MDRCLCVVPGEVCNGWERAYFFFFHSVYSFASYILFILASSVTVSNWYGDEGYSPFPVRCFRQATIYTLYGGVPLYRLIYQVMHRELSVYRSTALPFMCHLFMNFFFFFVAHIFWLYGWMVAHNFVRSNVTFSTLLLALYR